MRFITTRAGTIRIDTAAYKCRALYPLGRTLIIPALLYGTWRRTNKPAPDTFPVNTRLPFFFLWHFRGNEDFLNKQTLLLIAIYPLSRCSAAPLSLVSPFWGFHLYGLLFVSLLDAKWEGGRKVEFSPLSRHNYPIPTANGRKFKIFLLDLTIASQTEWKHIRYNSATNGGQMDRCFGL